MNDRKPKKRAPVPPGPALPPVNCAFDELVPLEQLAPNPHNPNQHPPGQVALLARVIAHQGWRSPIVVSTRSGFIVTGHGRFEAAKALGLPNVPVDYQDFATEVDEWAHLVADNRLAELAEVDEAALKGLLAGLKVGDFDLELAGFDAATLADLMAEAAPPADFPTFDENVPTEFVCPKCKFAWSGKPA